MSAGPRSGPDAIANDLAIAAKNAAAKLRLGRARRLKQLYALAGFALSAHNIAFHITLILFGCACLLSGYLIFKSGYLPKFIGLLMQLAGACYLIAAFAELFAPAVADLLSPGILIPPLIGESSLCLWLLVMGVNVPKWNERLGLGARA